MDSEDHQPAGSLGINTHHHGDHAGGEPVFAKIAPIIARGTRDRILSGYQSAAKNAPMPWHARSRARGAGPKDWREDRAGSGSARPRADEREDGRVDRRQSVADAHL